MSFSAFDFDGKLVVVTNGSAKLRYFSLLVFFANFFPPVHVIELPFKAKKPLPDRDVIVP